MTTGAWWCLAILFLFVISVAVLIGAVFSHSGDISREEEENESKRISRRLRND